MTRDPETWRFEILKSKELIKIKEERLFQALAPHIMFRNQHSS